MRVLVLVAVVLVVATSGLIGPAATEPIPNPEDAPPENAPTQNASYEIRFYLDRSGGPARIDVRVKYPARTAGEAARARNDSLDPAWFDGPDRVRQLFNQSADANDSLDLGDSVSTNHAEELAGLTPSDPEHGWILLRYTAVWDGYFDPEDDRVAIGRAYTDVLPDHWTLVVDVPSDWQPETVNGNPSTSSSGEAGVAYEWDVGNQSDYPLIVFNESVIDREPTDGDGGFGVASGLVLPVIALIALLLLARVR